jgi:hypothetical protein
MLTRAGTGWPGFLEMFSLEVSLAFLCYDMNTANLSAGGTPTGRVLEAVLKHQIDRLDGLLPDQYASEPPLDIIVLTDGVPGTS